MWCGGMSVPIQARKTGLGKGLTQDWRWWMVEVHKCLQPAPMNVVQVGLRHKQTMLEIGTGSQLSCSCAQLEKDGRA